MEYSTIPLASRPYRSSWWAKKKHELGIKTSTVRWERGKVSQKSIGRLHGLGDLMAPKVSSKWFGKQIKGCGNKRSQRCKEVFFCQSDSMSRNRLSAVFPEASHGQGEPRLSFSDGYMLSNNSIWDSSMDGWVKTAVYCLLLCSMFCGTRTM